MRKIIILSAMILLFCMSFSAVFGEDVTFFEYLNGRSRQWVERNYPDYKMLPEDDDIWAGYYIIEQAQCKDGGIIMTVGFDGPEGKTNEVKTVGLFAQGCEEYIPDGDIAVATKLFTEILGLDKNMDEAKVMMDIEDFVSLMFPNKILFDVIRRYDQDKKNYCFISDTMQFN